MKTDLLFENALALFTPGATTRAAQLLTEDAEAVRYGLSGIVPLVAEAINDRAQNADILGLAEEYSQDAAYSDPEALMYSADYREWLGDNRGLLSTVFGSRAADVIQTVADKAKLRVESLRALALTAIPAVLGLIGRANRREREKLENNGGKMPSYFVNE